MRKYENLNRIQENRLKQRAYYIPEGSMISLNGTWDFKYYSSDMNPIPAKECNIDVPSCWQYRGIEKPYYTNVIYPFPVDPPYVPMENPLGVYTRNFVIDNISGKYYLVFDGVSSCVELCINDRYVGYSQGSHMQAEFDITDFLIEGSNKITAKVYKWCSGSYLEDQDCFRNNGIFRDVYILSRPVGHVFDINIKTESNKILIQTDVSANITVYDPLGNFVTETFCDKETEIAIDEPLLWNAEEPNLYTILFKKNGEIIRQKIGFVTYQTDKNGAFLVNGVPVKLKGINHHDTDPNNGSAMTLDALKNDLFLMKQLNINCIRTSHYPPMPQMLDLCDEMGFYVMLEADLETHGFINRYAGGTGYDCVHNNQDWPGNQEVWLPSYIDRIERAYERDKNHSCIFAWSTGNESGHCENHYQMIQWLRQHDRKRFIHAEDCSRAADETNEALKAPQFYSRPDLHSRMYPSIESMVEYAKDASKPLPYFLCEYSHAMGNGPGDIADYWKEIYKYPKLIGGCIWEWADHVFLEDNIPKYGGDSGELTSDYNFCADGLVNYERKLKSGSLNAKYTYQYISFSLSGSSVLIQNLHDFINLDVYCLNVQVVCDGKVIETHEYILNVSPKETASVDITIPEVCYWGCFVVCKAYRNHTLMALWEGKLDVPVLPMEKSRGYGSITDCPGFYTLSGAGNSYKISKITALPFSIIKNGSEQLAVPVNLSVWRAPTDNDRNIKNKWGHPNTWEGENYDRVFNHIYESCLSDQNVTFSGSLAGIGRTPFLKYNLSYRIHDDGHLCLSIICDVRENCYWLPRFGFEFSLTDIRPFKYFGKGPYENYCDMNRHVTTDWFESNVENEYVPYVRPQDHGNHTDCKILSIENGLTFSTEDVFECMISKYSTQTLTEAEHIDELSEDGNMHVRIDYRNSGLGSNSCGPELIKQYRLDEKKFSFSFEIY